MARHFQPSTVKNLQHIRPSVGKYSYWKARSRFYTLLNPITQ